MVKRKLILLLVPISFLGFYIGYKIDTKTGNLDNSSSDINIENIESDNKSLSNFFSDTVASANRAVKGDLKTKFNEAKDKSRNTKGWIYVENSRINYPVMLGENAYYLNRTFDGKPSADGAIFLDQSQAGFGAVNVIHGHNLINGRMFSDLHKFYRKETTNDMKYAYIYDGESDIEKKYEVFSTIRVPVSYNIKLNIKKIPEMRQYAEELKAQSLYKYNHELTDNPILIINTCMSDGSNDHLLIVMQEV